MERIELPDFLVIAEIHSGIDAHQLARMPRVTTLATTALATPFAGFGDFELFPKVGQKAAIYWARISEYQPLPDGNKRTGYDVMREFIERNNYTFTYPPGGAEELDHLIRGLASHAITEHEFVSAIVALIQGPEHS